MPRSVKIFLLSIFTIFLIAIAIVSATVLIFEYREDEIKNTPYMLTVKGCDDYENATNDELLEYIVEFDLSEMSKAKYKKYILKQRKLINESVYSDYYNKEKCLNLFDRIEKIIDDDSNA